MQTSRVELSFGNELPAEFRVFTFGEVETTKGNFLFDDVSAEMVLSEYAKHGIDLMIDYDHASLGTAQAPDPATAGKAAGWFQLALRDGELWAVNVRWTPPARAALSNKEWRFISPAFTTDSNRRITSLLNVAITNLPATRKLEPLVGASRMTPDAVKEALDALVAEDTAKCAEILKDIIAQAASGEAPASEESAPEVVVEEPAAETSSDTEEEEPEAAVAASIKLQRLTGKKSLTASVAEVEVWRASHLELETERQKLAAERALLEAAERRKGCADLVKLGGRAPSTVWSDDTAKAPKKYLAEMPIASFREYVADALKASKPAPAPKTVAASTEGRVINTPKGQVSLSTRELAYCAEVGAKPEVYAANKAALKGK